MKLENNDDYKMLVNKWRTKSNSELDELFDWIREDSNKQLKELLNAVTDEDTRGFIDYGFTMLLQNNWYIMGLLINALKDDEN